MHPGQSWGARARTSCWGRLTVAAAPGLGVAELVICSWVATEETVPPKRQSGWTPVGRCPHLDSHLLPVLDGGCSSTAHVPLFQITALKIKYNPFAKAFLDAKER